MCLNELPVLRGSTRIVYGWGVYFHLNCQHERKGFQQLALFLSLLCSILPQFKDLHHCYFPSQLLQSVSLSLFIVVLMIPMNCILCTLKVLTHNIFMSPDKSSKTWESQQGSYSDLAKVLNFLTLPWDLFIFPLVLSPTIRIMAVSHTKYNEVYRSFYPLNFAGHA